MSAANHRIEELRAEARYARERYHLYRAKMYGMRPTSESRLRELQRIHEGAAARLRRAEQEQQTGAAGTGGGPADAESTTAAPQQP